MKTKKLLCMLLALLLLFSLCGCSMTDYKKAEEALAAEEYETALAAYEALGDYKDSADKARLCRYQIALILEEQKEYETAASLFEELGSYEDCEKRLSNCRDRLLEQAVVGKWTTDSIDLTQVFAEALQEYFTSAGDEASLELMNFCEFKDLAVKFCITLKENGGFSFYPDNASLDAYFSNIISQMKVGMLKYYELVFKENCKEQGITYDQLLEYYGAEDVESLLLVLGIDLDDILTSMKPLFDSAISSAKYDGKYHAQNGKLYLGNGDAMIRSQYDEEKDQILCSRDGLEDYYGEGSDFMIFKRSK